MFLGITFLRLQYIAHSYDCPPQAPRKSPVIYRQPPNSLRHTRPDRFASGTTIPIVERLGVYFDRLKIKGKVASEDFHRQATP